MKKKELRSAYCKDKGYGSFNNHNENDYVLWLEEKFKEQELFGNKLAQFRVIKCKEGRIFSAIEQDRIDDDWLREQKHYYEQGCAVEAVDKVEFKDCGCLHCQSLNHEINN